MCLTHIIQSSLDLQWRLLLWEALGAGCVGPVALWQSARGQPFCYCKVFWGVLQGVQPAGACVWGFGRGPVCAWSVVPKGDVDSPPLRFSCGHFFVASDTKLGINAECHTQSRQANAGIPYFNDLCRYLCFFTNLSFVATLCCKKMVNLFINKVLLIRAYASVRHNVIVHLLDYSINITFYALGNQKFTWLALLWGSQISLHGMVCLCEIPYPLIMHSAFMECWLQNTTWVAGCMGCWGGGRACEFQKDWEISSGSTHRCIICLTAHHLGFTDKCPYPVFMFVLRGVLIENNVCSNWNNWVTILRAELSGKKRAHLKLWEKLN